MSPEVWQFVAAAAALVVVVALWLLFVYKPRRTGEGRPRGVDPARKPPEGTDNKEQ